MNLKKIAIFLVAGLFVYLSLYTWNLRSGHLTRLSTYSGLDSVGTVLRPGRWAGSVADGFVDRYVDLVGLKQQNEALEAEVKALRLENMTLRERAEATARVERLLAFPEPPDWRREGARVIAQRVGPTAILETILVDRGKLSGAVEDTPVLSPEGVVGRIYRAGLTASTVLLLTDPSSRIAVVGRDNRAAGVVYGMGEGEKLVVKYVGLTSTIEQGEILVTSGMDGVYPKGLPVARVTSVKREEATLFMEVRAEPMTDSARLEEVLLLKRAAQPEDTRALWE
ncbi:rod shape-determining protein MreC [Humidesulfovibrio mexicanus]|uniref:Cell shape-determining protein MreC n=1 Tax=Humidesulfovibrio mexicanus TaxID=147047 RepID=A0A239CKA6_9BACT|nr:rod shape-determining protein MreC [Humidesulfovibrio mexicanus]SNS20101.1 rod shape-determining protein MreC [Humidesulfovibrio mexicanus]